MKNDSLYLIALYTLRGLGLVLVALIPATFVMKPRSTSGFEDLMPGTVLIQNTADGARSNSRTLTICAEPCSVEVREGRG